jgi:NAD(P)-dependent dehydrogenase (short-subunit alcohol dehydrogenase family)
VQALAGKVAVVTGAASGIGLALARRFGQDGMHVVMADIEQPALEREASLLAGEGIDVLARVTDTSLESDVEALAEATISRFGGVHVVCNNAGVGSRGLKVVDLPRLDFEWVIGVNLWGVVNGIRAFLPRLVAQDEGHIVNTASVSGLFHRPRMGPYNTTKAAVVALSETIKFELDEDDSNVGAVPELGAHEHLERRAQSARAAALRAHSRAGGGDAGVQGRPPPTAARRGDRRRRGGDAGA